MSRCIAYNKNNKKCRAKLENGKIFCCDKHYPINKEIINEGCFICSEKINNTNELIYLKCHHAFHKECYNEWLKYSTYETSVCIICLKEAFKPQLIKKKRKKKVNNIEDYLFFENKLNKLNKLNTILGINLI